MQQIMLSLAATTVLVALLAAGSPAQAAFATFASGNGSDSNDCLTPANACREIGGATGALSKIETTGTVHVLPGSYLAFSIPTDFSVSIIAEGGLVSIVDSSISIPGGGFAEILVTFASTGGVVRIRGFEIDASSGGIAVVGVGSTLHIEHCVLVPTSGSPGVDVRTSSGTAEVFVTDTTIARPSGAPTGSGIRIRPTGSAGAKVVLNNVNVDDNGSGITVDGRSTTGTNSVTMRNSTVSGSDLFGLFAIDSGTGATNVAVEGSTISNNDQQGIIANGANVTVRVRSSVITGNRVGLAVSNGGKIISHGDNVNAGNTAGQGAFTQTLAPQ